MTGGPSPCALRIALRFTVGRNSRPTGGPGSPRGRPCRAPPCLALPPLHLIHLPFERRLLSWFCLSCTPLASWNIGFPGTSVCLC